jgi:predicted nucleic acid-binding protein
VRRRYLKISKPLEIIVVDANPILSGLIKGNSINIFWKKEIKVFATTEFTLQEIKKYIPSLAVKAGLMKEVLFFDLALLPLKIYPKDFYADHLEQAKERIGKRDPKDADLLALALKLKAPIWTNDRDFEDTGVELFPTAKLFKFLEEE